LLWNRIEIQRKGVFIRVAEIKSPSETFQEPAEDLFFFILAASQVGMSGLTGNKPVAHPDDAVKPFQLGEST